MAVYKATYCYPLGNNIDIRVVADHTDQTPCEWFKCQVGTSNKRVTGYKIRILDNLNRQIFPIGKGKISPISELEGIQDADNLMVEEWMNSGLNGTPLNIPFFQNWNQSNSNLKVPSYNAIYYKPKYKAHYINTYGNGTWQMTTDSFNNEVLFWSGWDGTMNGDSVSEGDIVLFPSDNDVQGMEGMWRIRANGTLIRYEDREGHSVKKADLANCMVVLTRGEQHNYIYKFNASSVMDATPVSTPELPATGENTMWVDISNNPIEFLMDGSSYKWEITLYQGEVDAIDTTKTVDGQTVTVKYMDYSSLDFEWFDATLTSGTILGSTNKRIQLASASDASGIIPEGTTNSPIVLQGKWIQLYDTNKNALGNRVYIQTYDATYGHVYPMSGKITPDLIADAKYAQCFKYANDPEYILSSDTVRIATSAPISSYTTDHRELFVTDPSNPDQKITNDQLGLFKIGSYTLQEGDLVLVKDQVNPWENGVYIAHLAGTRWTRSGSYRTWASFMGKIIYAQENGKNYQSSAQTFGTIYNPEQGDTGNSPLYFLEEKPLTLFPSQLKATVNYLYVDGTSNPTTTGQASASYVLDGYTVNDESFVGQTFMVCATGKIYKIASVTNTGGTYGFTCTEMNTISTSDIVKVEYGRLYAGNCVKRIDESATPVTDINPDPNLAVVLKNDYNKTFISPYIKLNTDMALKLQNHIQIYYYNSTQERYLPTEWVRLVSVNTKLWYIEHGTYYDKNHNRIKFLSMSDEDDSVPYTYDVKTYYKASDENPFYVSEMAYLTLSSDQGSLTGVVQWSSFQVLDNTENYEDYEVLTSALTEYEQYLVSSADARLIRNRYVTLYGQYHQFQQASWESYRWILKNYYGDILQDTGERYDRAMQVSFYGLSNNSINNSNRYTAELHVIDNIGNTLVYSCNLIVDPTAPETVDILFNANFDCDTHSVILSYQDSVYVLPTQKVIQPGQTEAMDVALRPNNETYYISSIVSSDVDENVMVINDTNEGESYALGVATTNYNDPVSNKVPLYNIATSDNYGLSSIVQSGIQYAHYFLNSQLNSEEIEVTGTEQLIKFSDDDVDSGYFEAEVFLNDNYCGNVLTYVMTDYNSSTGVADSSITFTIKTRETMDSGRTTLFVSRNLFEAGVTYDSGGGTPLSASLDRSNYPDGITFFSVPKEYDATLTYQVGDYVMHENKMYRCSVAIATAETWNAAHWSLIANKFRYQLQPVTTNTLLNPNTLFIENDRLGDPLYREYEYYLFKSSPYSGENLIGEVFYVPIKNTQGNVVKYINSEKPLGNCCLNSNDETTYWHEDWGTLSYYSGALIYNNSGINLQQHVDRPHWPVSAEQSQYWTEEEGTDYPLTINKMEEAFKANYSGEYLHEFYSIPHHPISVQERRQYRDYSYRFRIKLPSYDGLKTNLQQSQVYVASVLAPDYSSSDTYIVGSLAIYNQRLYECIEAIPVAEAWDPTHWRLVEPDRIMQETLQFRDSVNHNTLATIIIDKVNNINS